jgi:hypothetical protein
MWKDIVGVMNKQMLLENRKTDLIICFDSVEEIVEHLRLKL